MNSIFNVEAQRERLSHRQAPNSDGATLPTQEAVQSANASLPDRNSADYLTGIGQEKVLIHIINDIVPALNGQASSARYYGFITGGVLPVAEWADNVVSRVDQNVMMHLPNQTVASNVEDSALQMLTSVLGLNKNWDWKGRTFTTGATASNVLGLACGREAVISKKSNGTASVGDLGVLGACIQAGITQIQVLTCAGHSSLFKAAGVVGLGRSSVKELRLVGDEPWRLDLDAVEKELQRPGTASIIAISAGEVNSGRFALSGKEDWLRVRQLADQYGAWLHVDGAFGIFAAALEDKDEYKLLRQRLDGVELADSITVDGHKLLNVPYDCGMFFTRSADTLKAVFTNPNAAYLAGGPAETIPLPLNIGIENSRRFRALPAYAVLRSEGKAGISALIANMVQMTRRVAKYLLDSPHYVLLPEESASLEDVFMTIMFQAKDDALNEVLIEKINDTRQMYVTGSSWKGKKAVRIAVSNWKVDVERDIKVVEGILTAVALGKTFVLEE